MILASVTSWTWRSLLTQVLLLLFWYLGFYFVYLVLYISNLSDGTFVFCLHKRAFSGFLVLTANIFASFLFSTSWSFHFYFASIIDNYLQSNHIATMLPVQILMFVLHGEFNVILSREGEISKMCLTKLVASSIYIYIFYIYILWGSNWNV